MVQNEHLTTANCDEVAEALLQDAAVLSERPERESLLELAEGYRDLADMKRMVLRQVN